MTNIRTEAEIEFLKKIGSNITSIRLQKGITALQVYEKLGIARTNYRRIEAGGTNMSILLLKRISKCLEVDLEELCRGI